MHPTYYRGCWHVVGRCFLWGYRQPDALLTLRVSFPLTGLYNPKTFITHAVSLRQTCVHCGRFLTAASRRSLGRISVPMWLVVLSNQLPIAALVGRYPTNKLMGHELILRRQLASRGHLSSKHHAALGAYPVLAAVSPCCSEPKGRLPTCYSPVRH